MYGDQPQDVDAPHVGADDAIPLRPRHQRSNAAVGEVRGVDELIDWDEATGDHGQSAHALFHASANEPFDGSPGVVRERGKRIFRLTSDGVDRVEADALEQRFLARVAPVHRSDTDAGSRCDRVD